LAAFFSLSAARLASFALPPFGLFISDLLLDLGCASNEEDGGCWVSGPIHGDVYVVSMCDTAAAAFTRRQLSASRATKRP
jgi:hypothetical protein